MDFLTAYHTDVGIKKATNEDSLCLKLADTSLGMVAFAVVCDGMGGLSKGEIASASVLNAFSAWFDTELPSFLAKRDYDGIRTRWGDIVKEQNTKIAQYGRQKNCMLGTTLTALLIIGDEIFIICHVGDSRVYHIKNEGLQVLTNDHSLVGQEVRRGIITMEQAENDPRRNILLQCVGASKRVETEFFAGKPNPNEVFMLCSDGFRHKLSSKEIYDELRPAKLTDEPVMAQKAKELTDLCKQRGETDNITVLVLKLQ